MEKKLSPVIRVVVESMEFGTLEVTKVRLRYIVIVIWIMIENNC